MISAADNPCAALSLWPEIDADESKCALCWRLGFFRVRPKADRIFPFPGFPAQRTEAVCVMFTENGNNFHFACHARKVFWPLSRTLLNAWYALKIVGKICLNPVEGEDSQVPQHSIRIIVFALAPFHTSCHERIVGIFCPLFSYILTNLATVSSGHIATFLLDPAQCFTETAPHSLVFFRMTCREDVSCRTGDSRIMAHSF